MEQYNSQLLLTLTHKEKRFAKANVSGIRPPPQTGAGAQFGLCALRQPFGDLQITIQALKSPNFFFSLCYSKY